jgi:hypothetical protein
MSPSRIILCFVVLTLASGCTGGSGKDVESVKKVPRAEAIGMVNDYAARTAGLITPGSKLENPATSAPPCEGRGGELSETVYYAAGHYQVAVPADRHLPTLRRLREHWQQEGYRIKRDREFPDGTGDLIVQSPADEFDITVASTDPPTAFALSISSPCYQSDEPYQPAATPTSSPR